MAEHPTSLHSARQPSAEEHLRLEIRGVGVDIVRKDIRNVHLAVYPPDGRVRLAVPRRVSDEAARLAVVDRWGWVLRQREAFARQPRQSARQMVTGESHYVWGRRVRLDIEHGPGKACVVRHRPTRLTLRVPAGASLERRQAVLSAWYREQLTGAIAPLVTAWESRMGVRVLDWQVRRMRTMWGSCSTERGHICINLELAKKPPECLEFIVVHEMVHLLERGHTERFRALMDGFLPDWRTRRDTLNRAPLAHEKWSY